MQSEGPVKFDYTIRIPQAEERQHKVLNDPSRFKVVAMGRRWGKTVSGLIAAVYGHGPIQPNGEPLFPGAIYGKKILWVAPSYPILSDIWRALKYAVEDATIDKNENDHRIQIPNGGSVTVRSTEKYDNLRGAGVDGMLLDEAAYISHAAWTRALRPMLLDRKGWAIFMSTPRGQNWFYHLYENAAKTPGWNRWTAPSTENPRVDAQEIAAIKADPELTQADYEQEYEAKFVVPGLNSFQEEWFRYYILDELDQTVTLIDDPEDSSKTRTYSLMELFRFGTVDLAISEKATADFSVFQIWGITPQNDLVLLHQVRDRMNNPTQQRTLQSLYEEWDVSYFGIESVAYQMAFIQQAIENGLPARKLTADKNKNARAAIATTRMAAHKIFFHQAAPYFRALKDEVLAFPHTKHDDQVDALAYAARMLGLRPKKMLVTPNKLDEYLKANLFSLTDYTNLSPILMEGADTQNPELVRESLEYATHFPSFAEAPKAIAYDANALLHNVSKRFVGDGFPYWHVHISLANSKQDAAIALSRIIRWDAMIETAEGQPYAIEVPFYEVPLVLKIVAPEDRNISPSVLSDFVIALKRIRNFSITSTSMSGISSSTVVQKLTRADIVVPGLKVDPESGIPMGAARMSSQSDEQPYSDLVQALDTKRINIVDSPFVKQELLQVSEDGESLTHESTAANAVAHSVGFLARYGHQELNRPEEPVVDLHQYVEPYSLSDYDYI